MFEIVDFIIENNFQVENMKLQLKILLTEVPVCHWNHTHTRLKSTATQSQDLKNLNGIECRLVYLIVDSRISDCV